ncbi:hypothetical protein EGJ54_24365 [Pandoraea apista]|nr:hypothetical protein EGJ54_24365 [Pandoraea apista]RRW98066.1 hypothetical protein EGJ56_23775 [Pandoraea apista]
MATYTRRLLGIASECRWDQLPALEADMNEFLDFRAAAGGGGSGLNAELKDVIDAYEATIRGLGDARDVLGRRIAELNEKRDGWKAYQTMNENDIWTV